MSKVLSGIYLIYAGIIFIALMFIALPFVLLASAILSKASGKRVILFLLRCWAWGFSAASFFWIKTKNANLISIEGLYSEFFNLPSPKTKKPLSFLKGFFDLGTTGLSPPAMMPDLSMSQHQTLVLLRKMAFLFSRKFSS